MTLRTNEYDQPIGPALDGWTPRAQPPQTPIDGRTCRLERLDAARHARDLHEAYRLAADGRDWTYMAGGPFDSFEAFAEYLARAAASTDPLHHAIVDRQSGKAVGTLALMRIDVASGVIEVGHIAYSPLMQRTPIGTEALYLIARRVFDELGYRRFEWKCDALNAPSRRAAARYGFQFEGIFRQAVVVKGRSRDTAWFSIIDSEWPARRAAFEQWLAPSNFDADGTQRAPLSQFMPQA